MDTLLVGIHTSPSAAVGQRHRLPGRAAQRAITHPPTHRRRWTAQLCTDQLAANRPRTTSGTVPERHMGCWFTYEQSVTWVTPHNSSSSSSSTNRRCRGSSSLGRLSLVAGDMDHCRQRQREEKRWGNVIADWQ